MTRRGTDHDLRNESSTRSGSQLPCLVIGFAAYTIRLLSPRIQQHLELIPVDFPGWDLPLHALDLRGVTLSSLLGDIDKAREQTGFDKVSVLGFSFSGMIALDYALAFPSHVSRVAAICSPPCWTSSYMAYRKSFQESELSVDRAEILKQNQLDWEYKVQTIPAEQRFIRYTLVQAPLYWYDPHFDESSYWEGLKMNLSLLGHIDSELYKEHDQTERFSHLTVPVFAAFGRHDFATPFNSWDPYRDNFRNLTLHVFEKSSHHPMVEEQELFDQKFLEWIQNDQIEIDRSGTARV